MNRERLSGYIESLNFMKEVTDKLKGPHCVGIVADPSNSENLAIGLMISNQDSRILIPKNISIAGENIEIIVTKGFGIPQAGPQTIRSRRTR